MPLGTQASNYKRRHVPKLTSIASPAAARAEACSSGRHELGPELPETQGGRRARGALCWPGPRPRGGRLNRAPPLPGMTLLGHLRPSSLLSPAPSSSTFQASLRPHHPSPVLLVGLRVKLESSDGILIINVSMSIMAAPTAWTLVFAGRVTPRPSTPQAARPSLSGERGHGCGGAPSGSQARLLRNMTFFFLPGWGLSCLDKDGQVGLETEAGPSGAPGTPPSPSSRSHIIAERERRWGTADVSATIHHRAFGKPARARGGGRGAESSRAGARSWAL